MRIALNLILATGLVLLSSCKSMNTPPKAQDDQTKTGITPKHFTATLEADYLLFLPKGYNASEPKRWPLMLFLHGAGERGDDVWRTSIHGPANYIKTHPDFPFILVSPQCPKGSKWSDDILLKLIDSISTTYAVDTNRIYLTGISMGGFGTWSLAMTYPERFAAVSPMCGGEGAIGALLSSIDSAKVKPLKSLPIWVFHGAKDPVVPLAASQHMVDLLKQLGNTNVTFTIYPDEGHNCWTVSYNNSELYSWFLSHKRGETK